MSSTSAPAPVRVAWRRGDAPGALLDREWLLANGLGGYASGTLAGIPTRRYHGLLVAALPGIGRVVALTRLDAVLRLPGGEAYPLGGGTASGASGPDGEARLTGFRLELGLPVWTYGVGGLTLEQRVLMPHAQNTVHVGFSVVEGAGSAVLELRPALHARRHEDLVGAQLPAYALTAVNGGFEVSPGGELPTLRFEVRGAPTTFTHREERMAQIYAAERSRGYAWEGALWSPGSFEVPLSHGAPVTFVASTEVWEVARALSPEAALSAETERRGRLLVRAPAPARRGAAAELVLAADAFLVTPVGRAEDAARSQAEGDEPRTVIAGYHWFTDWGRDTMISLRGLALSTGRAAAAGRILRAFARHLRDGLIPNYFPEGDAEGVYHTADATLWFFHALDAYVAATGDRATLRQLLPGLENAVACHQRDTRFGIGVDPADGLLRQGAEGYQLTWMDAKVDGWVVTPRRGKAVEINALWYGALRILEGWLRQEGRAADAKPIAHAAECARESFNRRFWFEAGGHLFDVVDGEDGKDDPAFRPNQLFAVALPYPVLDPARWNAVVSTVREKLLTPVGLRSLARDHPDYQPSYHGDLRTRDAAYHQGTVWSWLMGPFVDAWLRVHPDDRPGARGFLDGLVAHLGEAGVGSVSEVFDAEPPFTPRGCIAQAWGVAELLRALLATEAEVPNAPSR